VTAEVTAEENAGKYEIPLVGMPLRVTGMTDNRVQTHTRLTALFSGVPRSAGTRKVK